MAQFSDLKRFKFYNNLCPIPGSRCKAYRVDGFNGWQNVCENWRLKPLDQRMIEAVSELSVRILSVIPNAEFEIYPMKYWTRLPREANGIHPNIPHLKIYFNKKAEFDQFKLVCDQIWLRPLSM